MQNTPALCTEQRWSERNVFWKELAGFQANVKDNKENLEIKVGLGPCSFGRLTSRQQAVEDLKCFEQKYPLSCFDEAEVCKAETQIMITENLSTQPIISRGLKLAHQIEREKYRGQEGKK